jgi:hypothetical protein
MTGQTQLAITPRDRFLEAAQKELIEFERREREFSKKERQERAACGSPPTRSVCELAGRFNKTVIAFLVSLSARLTTPTRAVSEPPSEAAHFARPAQLAASFLSNRARISPYKAEVPQPARQCLLQADLAKRWQNSRDRLEFNPTPTACSSAGFS